MFDINNVNQTTLDFFREIENIGAGHAATALSMMTGRQIIISVPRAQLCGYNEITHIMNGPENVVVGLLVGISDDLRGFILLVLDLKDARVLVSTLLGEPMENVSEDGEFSEMQVSALREVANILIGSYITAISELTGLCINALVPELVVDMAGAVMNLSPLPRNMVTTCSFETFSDQGNPCTAISSDTDIESYQTLLTKMGIS